MKLKDLKIDIIILNGSKARYRLKNEDLKIHRNIVPNDEYEDDKTLPENYEIVEYEKVWIYKCKKTKNTLVISYNMFDHEYEKVTANESLIVDIPINSIMPEPFKYLVNELEKHKNITAFISHTYGTTTDYVIYYGEYDGNEPKSFGYKYGFITDITQDVSAINF